MIQYEKQTVLLRCGTFFAFLLFLQLHLISAPISNKEYNSLVNFFKAASGEKWNIKWDITKNNVHEGGWHGVKVEDGKVVEIDLQDNNLQGTIHNDIGNLTGLRSLNLSFNNLTGSVSFSFNNLPNIKSLTLKNNSLTSISTKYPASLNLDISSQILDYPQFIYSGKDVEIVLPDICTLGSGLNQFKVTINVGNDLKEIQVTSTEDGKILIPKNFIESANLDLNKKPIVIIHQISGLATGTQLKYNQVGVANAKIPDSEFEFLKELFETTAGLGWKMQWDISTNNVHEGGWAGVIVENGHVVELNLQSNQLRGTLPKSINNLKLLRVLNLNNNVALEGALPKEIEDLKELTSLNLYNCRFKGDITLDFSQMPQLKNIDFRYNQFSTIKAGINRGVNLYIQNQNILYDQFRYRGDTVDIKLPNIMLYDYSADNYSARNTIFFYINDNHVATMKANPEGYVRIPKTLLTSLNAKDVVRIYQHEGNAAQTNINFKTVDILTKKIPDSEYEALVAIYNALNGANWGNGYIWDISSNNLHTSVWPGVTVEDGHVTGLDLYNANKKGVLPKEIGNLPMLRTLNLNHRRYWDDKLSGNIPEEIGKLINLEYFYASDNNLSGTIPASLGYLTKLKELHLNYNSLGGSLPQDFSNSESLGNLHLDHNSSSEDIPNELKNLNNLVTLNLSNNKFSGKLPSFFPELSSLTTLDLSGNSFSGAIPKEYGSKIKLSSLNLSGNKLDSIEAGLARGLYSVNLTGQSLNRNLFTFTGDTVEVLLPAIMRYNYDKNDYSARNNISFRLSGSEIGQVLQCDDNGLLRIPKEYMQTINKNHKVSLYQNYTNNNGSCSHNSTLSFDSLVINTKKIPDSEYEALVAIYNALNGANWGNGYIWDISSNNLHTSVWPGVIVEDGHVIGLDLNHANKKGVLPKEIGNLPMLRTLNLNHRYWGWDKLSGILPEEIGKLVNLEYFYARDNNLSGTIPASINNLTKLKEINLSYNSISGTLPDLFSSSPNLQSVNLYSNRIDSIGNGLKAGMSIDMRYQYCRESVFTYMGDTVDIQLPTVMRYDYAINGFTTKNNFDVGYGNTTLISNLQANKDGILRIPKEVLKTLRTQNNLHVTIYQKSGSSYGSSLTFDSVKVKLDPIPQKEYEALIAIYNKLGGTYWQTKWDVTKGNNVYEGWHGVVIEDGHVVEINLSDNNLSGQIPSEIGDFSKLRVLNLANNNNGYYKNIKGNIPSEIGRLTELEDLRIFNQALTGEITFWIDKLEKLKIIMLGKNYLTGSLPESIEKLTQLNHLDISNNKFQGGIPERLGNLQYLDYLNLSYNEFSGTIPSSLNNLPSIKYLYLNYNLFDGMESKLPYQPHIDVNVQNQKITKDKILINGDYILYDLPIICRYDHIGGDLFAANTFYIYVDDVKNSAPIKATDSGRLSIPRGYFSALKTDSKIKFEQSNGSAQGTTIEFNKYYVGKPVDDKEYKALVELYETTGGKDWTYTWDVSKNNLHERMWYGVVIEDGHVVKLELQNNQLKGELPASLNQLTYLKELSLYNNNLTGTIPTSIGTMDSLSHVYLYKNKLTGSIPSSLFDLKNIRVLLLNNNQLSGDISDKILKIPNLRIFNISDNNFNGTIPDVLFKLPAIKELYLSKNKYNSMNQAFDYADTISVYLETQKIDMPDYVLVEGTSVKAKSVVLNTYDIISHSFNAQNTFELYLENKMVAQSSLIEDGLIIFNTILKDYKDIKNVYVIQRNGAAYGTIMNYQGIKDASQAQIEDSEYLALVRLNEELGGDNWKNKWDVSKNDIHLGEWFGVYFTNGHITGIKLESNNLSGHLPDVFKELPYLTIFDIAVNKVKGNIPASLMSLKSLKNVVLSDNLLNTMDKVAFDKNVNLNMARQIVEYPNFAFNQYSVLTASNIHRYNHVTSLFASKVTYRLTMGTVSRNIKIDNTYSLGHIMKRWSISQGQLLELELLDNSAGNNSHDKYYLTFKDGDVDMNDLTNILDIQLLIQDMQSQISSSVFFNETAADINKDGNRNILDVVAIANLIQNKKLEADESITRMSRKELSDQPVLSIEEGILYMNTLKPVNAFDIRIRNANISKIEKLYANKEMSISIVQNADGISILGFSPSDAALQGKVAIANVGDATIDDAILSDREAKPVAWKLADSGIENEETSTTGIQNYPNPFSNSTTVRFHLQDRVQSGELIIYSLANKIVYKEKLTELNAGNHEITIQLGNMVSGVYPYILKVKTTKGTKIYRNKMMIK